MGSWEDTWSSGDLCRDLEDDCSCDDRRTRRGFDRDCGCDGHDDWRRRKRRKPIRVGNVTVDCTPVSFRTPGQAVNIVSCPVTEVLNVPVTRQVNVQVPLGIPGCVLNVPVVEKVQVPVVTTVNLPPVLIPQPSIICPGITTLTQ
jgi:hypothetical protein